MIRKVRWYTPSGMKARWVVEDGLDKKEFMSEFEARAYENQKKWRRRK